MESALKVPPPPSETNPTDLPSLEKTAHNEQLIFKSPHSCNDSVKSVKKPFFTVNKISLILAFLQLSLGLLMVLFGVYVINYKASLSHLAGGIWGGILAMVTGITGILAAANHCCPFKVQARKICHTSFLALSLISIAVSQLVVVICSTGLARDVDSRKFLDKVENMTTFEKLYTEIPQNCKEILFNILLLITSALELITASITSYRSSKQICPCFRPSEDFYQDNLNISRSNALVSSWLMEKHPTSQIYVVAGSTLGRGSKVSSLMPVYALSPPIMQQPIMTYPLIPAPLGSVPSPLIPPARKLHTVHKHYKSKSKSKSRSREATPRKISESRIKERQMSDEEVVKTYTGLDRTIAEEFINICESKNSTCSGSSDCHSPLGSTKNDSCADSQDCLVAKL